jgi:hypothetical protein
MRSRLVERVEKYIEKETLANSSVTYTLSFRCGALKTMAACPTLVEARRQRDRCVVARARHTARLKV